MMTPKEDIEFSDEYRDFDEEVESMIEAVPFLKKKLEAYVNQGSEQFGVRKFRRQSIQGPIVHGAGFLARRAHEQALSSKQHKKYVEMLRGFAALLPLIRKAKIKLPGLLKDDLKKYTSENTS